MTLSEELQWRGFVNQTTISDSKKLDTDTFTFFLGVDPSAPSMTIGNLAMIMMARLFAKRGHIPYLLVGGATGLIGDPDGKKQERDMRDTAAIADSSTGIKSQFNQLMPGIQIVNNLDWFSGLGYIDFLRDIGKHVPMRQMLGREFIQTRLGEGGTGISYGEFSYVLIQAYDFLYLHEKYGVNLQLCGSDQWGNSIAGVDLIRRKTSAEAHVWSGPLVINKSTGVKFGKSEDGAIWLDPQLTSPYKFYQFWLNVDDAGVIDYLKIYTELSYEQIKELELSLQNSPGERRAQKALAYEVTLIVHGLDVAESVVKATDLLFGGANNAAAIDEQTQSVLLQEIPSSTTQQTITELIMSVGLAASKGEARRLIAGGAISFNGQKMTDDVLLESPGLLKKGKNSFVLIQDR